MHESFSRGSRSLSKLSPERRRDGQLVLLVHDQCGPNGPNVEISISIFVKRGVNRDDTCSFKCVNKDS